FLEDRADEGRVILHHGFRRGGDGEPLVDLFEQGKLMGADEVALAAKVVPEIAFRDAHRLCDARRRYGVIAVLVEEPQARGENPVFGFWCHPRIFFLFSPSCRSGNAVSCRLPYGTCALAFIGSIP